MRDAGSVSDESSSEDGARVVKSAKDKRLEELEGTVKAIENGEKINDWGSISAGILERVMFLGSKL
jgi:translation initiation factor 3 subunit C